MPSPIPPTPTANSQAWLAMPTDKKTQLLNLLSADRTDVIIIATPATSDEQLNAALTEAAGATIGIRKRSLKPSRTVSLVYVRRRAQSYMRTQHAWRRSIRAYSLGILTNYA